MSLQSVTVHRTITDVNVESWDRLVAESAFHLSSAWLASSERNRDGKVFYVVAGDGTAGPQGSAVGHLVEASPTSNRDSLNRLSRIDHILTTALSAGSPEAPESTEVQALTGRMLPGLACGGVTLANSMLSLADGLDRSERRATAERLLDGLERVARESGARSVNFPYVEDRNDELREVLLARGYIEFPVAAHSVLNMMWDSFDGYLDHLPYDRRRAIKRELAKLDEAGVAFRVVPLDDELVERLWPMGAATVERHAGSAAADQILARLRMLAGCSSQVILAEQEGHLRGFGVVVPWKSQLYARMVGFDYSVPSNLPVYFGIMYEQIKVAASQGLRTIEYYTTTDRAKATRGATSIPQHGYVRVFDPVDADRLTALLTV
ncbi:hypothetical protein GCM10009760_21300 [Kitasatospora kazusensis]|uniref:GNAT family N-acetyltransferase n=1 Tax=Kitasatospora kazusensis TaxID=407974 RepID=A0ABP5L137_9ACTN